MTTATKQVHEMDLVTAEAVLDSEEALSTQVTDQVVAAIRAMILIGVGGEKATARAFGFLMGLVREGKVITEAQKAALVSGLAKTDATAYRYRMIAEIITSEFVAPPTRSTDTWQSLRTALNKVETELLGGLPDAIKTKSEELGRQIRYSEVVSVIGNLTPKVVKEISPQTRLGGYLKTSENSIVKAHAEFSAGVVMTDEQRAIAERQYALLGVILGK